MGSNAAALCSREWQWARSLLTLAPRIFYTVVLPGSLPTSNEEPLKGCSGYCETGLFQHKKSVPSGHGPKGKLYSLGDQIKLSPLCSPAYFLALVVDGDW